MKPFLRIAPCDHAALTHRGRRNLTRLYWFESSETPEQIAESASGPASILTVRGRSNAEGNDWLTDFRGSKRVAYAQQIRGTGSTRGHRSVTPNLPVQMKIGA